MSDVKPASGLGKLFKYFGVIIALIYLMRALAYRLFVDNTGMNEEAGLVSVAFVLVLIVLSLAFLIWMITSIRNKNRESVKISRLNLIACIAAVVLGILYDVNIYNLIMGSAG